MTLYEKKKQNLSSPYKPPFLADFRIHKLMISKHNSKGGRNEIVNSMFSFWRWNREEEVSQSAYSLKQKVSSEIHRFRPLMQNRDEALSKCASLPIPPINSPLCVRVCVCARARVCVCVFHRFSPWPAYVNEFQKTGVFWSPFPVGKSEDF